MLDVSNTLLHCAVLASMQHTWWKHSLRDRVVFVLACRRVVNIREDRDRSFDYALACQIAHHT